MARLLLVVLALLALTAAEGRAAPLPVYVVEGLDMGELEQLASQGAVGLLVPGPGPETSRALALAALERGKTRNSLRGGLPAGPILVRARAVDELAVGAEGIVLALPAGGTEPNDDRYPIAVLGRGWAGLLVSESTRIPGLVSIVDVAPTARGRPRGLSSTAADDPAGKLRELDRRIDRNNDSRRAAVVLVSGLVIALVLVFPPAAVAALAAAALANLALGAADVSAPWAVILVLALAVAVGGPLVALARPGPTALGVGLVAVVALYLLTLGLDGAAVSLSPLGPTQNGRFYGLSNLLETLLLLPALGGAALLARRFGWPAFGAVAVLTFVTVAGNRFGADGGGAIVLAAGFAVLGALLAGADKRTLAIALTAGLTLGVGLLALDAATGASSHVTRALEDGPGGLAADLRDRVVLSYERATDTLFSTTGIAALFLALAVLVALTLVREGAGQSTAVPLALAAALATSLVVNDSPVDVLLVGLAAYAAADLAMLRGRWPGHVSSPWSPSPSPSQSGAVVEGMRSHRSPRR